MLKFKNFLVISIRSIFILTAKFVVSDSFEGFLQLTFFRGFDPGPG